jgi:hypothetical protein
MNETFDLKEENIYFGGADDDKLSVDPSIESIVESGSNPVDKLDGVVDVKTSANIGVESDAKFVDNLDVESGAKPVNYLDNVVDVNPNDQPNAKPDDQSMLGANRSYEGDIDMDANKLDDDGSNSIQQENNFETLFIKDIDNYNQLKILINFCNKDNNINLINFINEEEDNKETFINYLELFNSSKINKKQVGGAGGKFIKYMRGFLNRFNKGDRKHNLKEAIDNMEKNMKNDEIKDEIENNNVYKFINLLNFDETNNTKLSIDHVKYNEFMKDFEKTYKIINYIQYTKDIEILFAEEGFISSVFNSNKKKNIYKMIKEFIDKYNKMRLSIFNNYLNIIKLQDEEEEEESEAQEAEAEAQEAEAESEAQEAEAESEAQEVEAESETQEAEEDGVAGNNSPSEEEDKKEEDKKVYKKVYKIYFNNISKNDKVISEYFSDEVSSVNNYIEKIKKYSDTQIEEIDKEIKEYIFLTSNKENIRIKSEQEEKDKQEVPHDIIGGKKYRKTKNKKYRKNKKPTKKRRKRRLSRKK